jgi:hypothetical protein
MTISFDIQRDGKISNPHPALSLIEGEGCLYEVGNMVFIGEVGFFMDHVTFEHSII